MYISPGDVHGPRRFLNAIKEILYDGGEGGWSAAVVTWAGEPDVLAMRWNGSEDRPLGSPQSTGHAVWFIVPRELSSVLLPHIRALAGQGIDYSDAIAESQALTRRLLPPSATVDDFIAERRREADRE